MRDSISSGSILILLLGSFVLGGAACAAPINTAGGPPGSTTAAPIPSVDNSNSIGHNSIKDFATSVERISSRSYDLYFKSKESGKSKDDGKSKDGSKSKESGKSKDDGKSKESGKSKDDGVVVDFIQWSAGGLRDVTSGLFYAITHPAETVADGANLLVDTADSAYRATMDAILGPLITAMVGVPTFGIGLTDGTPGIHAPTRWPFKGLFSLYIGVQALTGAVLMISVAASFLRAGVPTKNTFRATQTSIRVLKAFFIGVVFHLLFIAILHTTVNAIAHSIAPSTSELASDLVKVLVTTTATALFGGALGQSVIYNLIKMWTLVWVILMLFPVISGPIFTVWQMRPDSTPGRISGTLIWMYFSLLFSKILVAIDLRAAWMLDWSLSPFGILNVFFTIAMFSLAFFIPPLVLISVLFSRSQALNSITSWTSGAVSESIVGQKVSEKGEEVKETVYERASTKGDEYKTRMTTRTQTTAGGAKQRVSTATGMYSGGRIGRYPREQRSSGDETFRSWTEDTETSTGEDTSTDDTDENDAGAASEEVAANTETIAQEIRDLKTLSRETGGLSPGQRQRYYDLQDQQKYGDIFRDMDKSTVRRRAEERYGNRGSADSGGLHSGRSTTTTSRTSERTSHPPDTPRHEDHVDEILGGTDSQQQNQDQQGGGEH